MDAATILHATALANTFRKRKIKLIRDEIEGSSPLVSVAVNNDVKKVKRRIMLMREPFKEKVVKKDKEKVVIMPPRKKPTTETLPPIEEKVTMVHVAVLEKKMAVLPVEDVETVRLVLHDHCGKTYYRDTAKKQTIPPRWSQSHRFLCGSMGPPPKHHSNRYLRLRHRIVIAINILQMKNVMYVKILISTPKLGVRQQ